jgi:hypothetical protein
VRVKEYVSPDPLKPDAVAFTRAKSLSVNPVTGLLKVAVTVALAPLKTASVEVDNITSTASPSNTIDQGLAAKLKLPAASLAALAPRLTVMVPDWEGVTSNE